MLEERSIFRDKLIVNCFAMYHLLGVREEVINCRGCDILNWFSVKVIVQTSFVIGPSELNCVWCLVYKEVKL